jgi:hypothetical protein
MFHDVRCAGHLAESAWCHRPEGKERGDWPVVGPKHLAPHVDGKAETGLIEVDDAIGKQPRDQGNA